MTPQAETGTSNVSRFTTSRFDFDVVRDQGGREQLVPVIKDARLSDLAGTVIECVSVRESGEQLGVATSIGSADY